MKNRKVSTKLMFACTLLVLGSNEINCSHGDLNASTVSIDKFCKRYSRVFELGSMQQSQLPSPEKKKEFHLDINRCCWEGNDDRTKELLFSLFQQGKGRIILEGTQARALDTNCTYSQGEAKGYGKQIKVHGKQREVVVVHDHNDDTISISPVGQQYCNRMLRDSLLQTLIDKLKPIVKIIKGGDMLPETDQMLSQFPGGLDRQSIPALVETNNLLSQELADRILKKEKQHQKDRRRNK